MSKEIEPYKPPEDPAGEEASRLERELGVEWASGNALIPLVSYDPEAPLRANLGVGSDLPADYPPMSQWKPFIPQGLVHAEADRAAAAAKALTNDMSWKRGMDDRQIMMIYDLIAAVDRLVPRYKELWDIASGIVNAENLKEDT